MLIYIVAYKGFSKNSSVLKSFNKNKLKCSHHNDHWPTKCASVTDNSFQKVIKHLIETRVKSCFVFYSSKTHAEYETRIVEI